MNSRDETLFGEADAGVESVGDFTRRLKALLKTQLRAGWIRGEISNLRAQSSGHFYFSLKDATAQLSCVLFRGDALRNTVALRDGLQVLVYGDVDLYEARGQYQLIVRVVVDHGAGKLQQQFEELKRRLAAEGLFAAERKQPLPLLPRTVGFITSPTGAAVQDFLRILQRRGWRGRVIVLPVKVQGPGSALEAAAAVKTACALGIFDLLVIGRGGGSLEDLWAFNEEPLVRAVAECSVPIISAVGHEIDYTLCDFAADARAETPSGAAELISSSYLAVQERLAKAREGLAFGLEDYVARGRERVEHAKSRLRLLSPAALIEQNYLKLDDCASRLRAALRHAVQERREKLAEVRGDLARVSPQRRVELESHKLLALWKRLESASPKSVLQRGFAIVRDAEGKPVTRAHAVQPGQALVNEFQDGAVRVIECGNQDSRKSP